MRNLRITKGFAAGLAVVGLACCTESPAYASEPAERYDPGNNPIYRKGWIDFNKNGRKDVYEDPEAALETVNSLINPYNAPLTAADLNIFQKP